MAVALVTPRILVVDDESLSRTLLKEILVPAGFEVVEAEDGQRALECLDQHSIQLIVTDRTMPLMDGLELLKALKTKKNKIPVLMVSAFGEEQFWAQAIGLGAVDYIVKPFKSDDVLKSIRKHIRPEKIK